MWKERSRASYRWREVKRVIHGSKKTAIFTLLDALEEKRKKEEKDSKRFPREGIFRF